MASPKSPSVTLELRHGTAAPTRHAIGSDEFLLGGVPGCDLTLPGHNLPPVIALVSRTSGKLVLRRMAPALPVLLNGQPISQAELHHGDTISVGPTDLIVHVGSAVTVPEPLPVAMPGIDRKTPGSVTFIPYTPAPKPGDSGRRDNDLRQQTAELQQRHADYAAFHDQLQQAADALTKQRQEFAAQQTHQAKSAELVGKERESLAKLRAEFDGLRQNALDQIRQQRDRSEAMAESVRHAAAKVQDERRQFRAEQEAAGPRGTELSRRAEQLDRRERELVQAGLQLEQQRQDADEQRQAETNRRTELERRERELTAEREALNAGRAGLAAEQSKLATDALRLERSREAAELQEQRTQERAAEVERRWVQMQADAADLEDQARQTDALSEKLQVEAERLTQRKKEVEAEAAKVGERQANAEGQQAMLAALRTRVEKTREEMRREAEAIALERQRQDALAAELQDRLLAAEKLRDTLAAEDAGRSEERRYFEERSLKLQAAVTSLRQLQDKLAGDETRLKERGEQLDAQTAELAEQTSLLKARAQQLNDLRLRLDADRDALRERESRLGESDETRLQLQEQLRRRAEELNQRQRQLEEQQRTAVDRTGAADAARAAVEAEVAELRQRLDARAADLDQQAAELAGRDAELARQIEQVKAAGVQLATERQAFQDALARWEADQQFARTKHEQTEADLDRFRQATMTQAADLHRLLPELEERGQQAADRLAQAREQLRGHLDELHQFARQSQDDLEAVRQQVQLEVERLRQQELALQRGRAEHRHAVTSFRQQLIDWQGRVGDLKQTFAQGEARLDRRTAALAEADEQAATTTRQLAEQAEQLQREQRQVTARRSEIEQHLGELRDWYRLKLRDLSGVAEHAVAAPLPDDLDAGDRQLGDLLGALGLVDPAALAGLLAEARRQRRSLRQVLLAGGTLTLYQLALIEAGNLDGLLVGPFHVVDRLRVTPRESQYRILDPRPQPAGTPPMPTRLLRHLAEGELLDAVRPGEYRARFAALEELRHPNLQATLELLEINARPAVVQEWVGGLPCGDWPALAAVPGVWYRLVNQAALGLFTAHQAGLCHGRLGPASVVLTPEGLVKLTGVGEPAWLAPAALLGEDDASPQRDLLALGRLAFDWSQRGPKKRTGKQLPDALRDLLTKLGTDPDTGTEGQTSYADAGDLLADLETAGSDIAANGEAWDRLVRYAGENGREAPALRRSA